MVKGRRFIYDKEFSGEPTLENFKLEEYDIPQIGDGEILCEAEFLSVDPYMRPYMARFPTGITMIGGQIAKVIESKNNNYPVGCYVSGQFGWQTLTVYKEGPKSDDPMLSPPMILPDFGKYSCSLGLGVLGMPGCTAYFGFLEICQPKSGETVVVNGAAGAVGSLVGQIAKIKGCKVIGYAGSDEKCDWLCKELGFDYAFNYKTTNVSESLAKAAPNGVDCFFDNVGGEMSTQIIKKMNSFGRISVCGIISAYNENVTNLPKVTTFLPTIVFQQLKMEGFIVTRWFKQWPEAIKEMLNWIKENKLKYRETVTTGFDNMPKAFIGMLKGENTGKAIVKV